MKRFKNVLGSFLLFLFFLLFFTSDSREVECFGVPKVKQVKDF